MKNKKLLIILISSFVALCLVVGGVVAVFSQLEKNPIGEDDTLVKHSGKDTLVFRETEFVSGNIITADDERLKNCVLLLDDQRGNRNIYDSKYVPLFREVTTTYRYRNQGRIILEKTELEKSKYQRTAYSDMTFELPEIKVENIKKIGVFYGDYYNSTEGYEIDGVSDFFSATVDADCPTFNMMKCHEIDQAKDIRDIVNEFNTTGALKESYKKWCKVSEKDNVFFRIYFFDDTIPFSLLFTEDAIFAQ
ncbi:MAG: hypothetical protein J6L91_01785 [Clostridia bacterium]|nr:hypothetical protein [Clostridia bacterium]